MTSRTIIKITMLLLLIVMSADAGIYYRTVTNHGNQEAALDEAQTSLRQIQGMTAKLSLSIAQFPISHSASDKNIITDIAHLSTTIDQSINIPAINNLCYAQMKHARQIIAVLPAAIEKMASPQAQHADSIANVASQLAMKMRNEISSASSNIDSVRTNMARSYSSATMMNIYGMGFISLVLLMCTIALMVMDKNRAGNTHPIVSDMAISPRHNGHNFVDMAMLYDTIRDARFAFARGVNEITVLAELTAGDTKTRKTINDFAAHSRDALRLMKKALEMAKAPTMAAIEAAPTTEAASETAHAPAETELAPSGTEVSPVETEEPVIETPTGEASQPRQRTSFRRRVADKGSRFQPS